MVKRSLQKQIDRAIEAATNDLPHDRVRNWCRHINITQINTSELGRWTGLPIGLKSVECPYSSSSIAMTLQQAAPSFIEEHCYGCAYHDELDSNNVGRQIIEMLEQRKKVDQEVAEARKTIERLRPDDPVVALAADPNTDETIRELVGLLVDSAHKSHAVSTLLKAAKSHPELFTSQAITALKAAVFDNEVGRFVFEILQLVGANDGDAIVSGAQIALTALERQVNEGAAATFLVVAVERAAIEPSLRIAELLVNSQLLSWSLYERSGSEESKRGVSNATRRFANLAFDLLAEATRRCLERPYSAARAVQQLPPAACSKLMLIERLRAYSILWLWHSRWKTTKLKPMARSAKPWQ